MSPQSHLRTTPAWIFGLTVSLALFTVFLFGIYVLLKEGVGIWGINIPVAWGFAITNFVWWIGIGHAGTFISAILLLVRQEKRSAISRFAETMTLFAVLCAGLFPLLHLGRPWFFYWLFPYPDVMNLWPQFRSPLVWDVFAVLTYLTVSFIFWYMSLIPDLAVYRDRNQSKFAQRFYGLLALGWRGSDTQWRFYKTTALLLAGLAAPLVIAVHSIVGLDFAASLMPGWHSTIYPPYFVAGAIFSGFAMVLTLGVPLRQALHLEDIISLDHIELCAKFLLAMGLFVSYGYAIEVFSAFLSGDAHEISMTVDRYTGAYAPISWLMIMCNVLVPQLLWFKSVRRAPWFLFFLSILVNVGMWCERFIIVVASLHHGLLPSSEHLFIPTRWDWIFLVGSMGMFLSLYLLFARFFPIISLTELREHHEIQGGQI